MPFTPKAVKGTGEGIEVPLLNLINRIARLADLVVRSTLIYRSTIYDLHNILKLTTVHAAGGITSTPRLADTAGCGPERQDVDAAIALVGRDVLRT
jgi:hypothetical protein